MEEGVSRGRLGGTVRQKPLGREPREQVLAVNHSSSRQAGARNHLGTSAVAEQHFDDTARFRTQTGELLFRQQPLRPDPGQHRQPLRAFRIIKEACNVSIAPAEDLIDVEVPLVGAAGLIVGDTLDFGKHTFTEPFERERMQAFQHFPIGFFDHAQSAAFSVLRGGRPRPGEVRECLLECPRLKQRGQRTEPEGFLLRGRTSGATPYRGVILSLSMIAETRAIAPIELGSRNESSTAPVKIR